VKKLIYSGAITLILLVIALSLWGNQIVERALDAKIAVILSKQLGIPVTLEPIRVNILRLSASSPKLVMGNPDTPAIVATDVQVSLSLSDLANREMRLRDASATALTVTPSRWPQSDSPWPEDYRFIEPWLPARLQLASGRYVGDNGDSYPLQALLWQRQTSGGATLGWSEQHSSGNRVFSAKLKSLDELLRLARTRLQLAIAVTGHKGSDITLTADLKPGDTTGYRLDSQIQAAGMTVQLVALNTTTWQLPARSTTTIDTLDPAAINTLIKAYFGSTGGDNSETLLASAVPKLSLPDHQGTVEITEIHLRDEVTRDNAFTFSSDKTGLNIGSISGNGPTGALRGHAAVVSTDAGWQVDIGARMTAREADQSLAAHYVNTDWLWRSGNIQLAGTGNTWGELLNSLEGEIQLAGSHRGPVQTPFKLDARLDNRPGEIALDNMDIKLGKGRIRGSLVLSGTDQRRLVARLKGEQLDLDFLFSEADASPLSGIALPEYLTALPGVELDGELYLQGLELPSMALATAQISLARTPVHGQLAVKAKDRTQGTMSLQLVANVPANKPHDVNLQINIAKFNIPMLFRQESTLLDSRSSGTIRFESQAKNFVEVFEAMRGTASLEIEFRTDNDWQRATGPEEKLQFSGDSRLVITDKRIMGLQISKLDIESINQDLTGTLSMVDDRTPWLIADLESDKLDISGLLKMTPESDDGSDPLKSIRKLGAMKISLDADSIILKAVPLSNMQLELTTAPDLFAVNRLDFTAFGGTFSSKGQVSWKQQRAQLSANAQASNFVLDSFLIQDPASPRVPVSGSITLQSLGSTFPELVANLTGEVDLKSAPTTATTPPENRRRIAMKARRSTQGLDASIDSFQWGESELSGKLSFADTEPPELELEISDGVLSLQPWERIPAPKGNGDSASPHAEHGITGVARASADFVGKLFMMPARLITGPGEAAPGEKFFSAKPLPFESIAKYRAKIHGKLSSVTSQKGSAGDVAFSAVLDQGKLSLQASADQINKGKGEFKLLVDANAAPPAVELTSTFEGVYGTPAQESFPRSGFVSLSSRGQSPAELAANLNGMAYLTLGRGPLDYRKLTLFTADIATAFFQTLIPGIEKLQPELDCGVTLATFKDGTGITPYGYAARTPQANLVGRIELDLKKELIQVVFSSSSRSGVGISVGNVFSNTVEVKGPLTDPEIVPNATGILWRGWAAFMTAGLSVVGESVYKRALASENPCESINKHIRKDVCSSGSPAAASPLVCPTS
jgi:hypothetical protein